MRKCTTLVSDAGNGTDSAMGQQGEYGASLYFPLHFGVNLRQINNFFFFFKEEM